MDAGTKADQALLERLASGDRAALQPIYQRHAPLLLALARRMLGRSGDAEDVLHDVFIEALQRAGDYDAALGTVRAWLVSRLRSRCLDRLRSSGRTRPLEERPPQAVEPVPQEDPALSLDRSRARRALADLPAAQRTVLDLAYFSGLSGSEIAAQLGIPLGTVKTRVALAMARLRRLMVGTEVTTDTNPDPQQTRTSPESRPVGDTLR